MSKSKRKQDFALGLTAIVMVAVFVGTVLFLARERIGATRPITVYFRADEGLAPVKKGSPVLLAGAIEVGYVNDVQVTELATGPQGTKETVVVVRAEVDRDIPLYGDCEITTDMPLIGGNGTVVITRVGTPGEPLAGDHIDGLPPQGMAAFAALSRRLTEKGGIMDRVDRMLNPDVEGSLLNLIRASVQDVKAMTGELKQQLSPAEQQTLMGKIHLVLDDVNAVVGSLRLQMQGDNADGVLAKVHAALDKLHEDLSEVQGMLAENRPAVRETLARVEHAARVVDEELVSRLGAEFDPRQEGSLLGQLHASMEELHAALANLRAMSDAGREMLLVNRPQLERTLSHIRETSAQLEQGVVELRLNPSRLIWGPPRREEKKLDVFLAARDFAQAAVCLDDAAARLEAVLAAGDKASAGVSEAQVRAVCESLQAAFERFQQAESFFWKQME